MVQIPGFRQHLSRGHYRVIRGSLEGGFHLSTDEFHMRLGKRGLHVVPVVEGAGGQRGAAIGKILAGVAIVAGAWALAGPGIGLFGAAWDGAALAVGTTTLLSYGNIAAFGIAVTLGGVSQLLAQSPKLTGGDASTDRRDSFLFGGQVNTTAQGGPVPIVCGKFRVGSTIISAGLSSEQLIKS